MRCSVSAGSDSPAIELGMSDPENTIGGMTTWRDIADQLTADQVDNLEWLEQDPLGGILAKPEQHLTLARGWASSNLEQSFHADVAPPADAVTVGPWVRSKNGEHCRSCGSSVIQIEGLDIALELRGSQYTDGRVEYRLGLKGDSLRDLDPAGARELAAALLDAIAGTGE